MDIEYRQLLVIPWSFILVKWSDCSEPKIGAKSFWRNSGQNILRFFEIINIQTEEILQNTIRINTNKTISRHNYHQIVKNKIEKKILMKAERKARHIIQKRVMMWKMTDFSAKQWRRENGITTLRFLETIDNSLMKWSS